MTVTYQVVGMYDDDTKQTVIVEVEPGESIVDAALDSGGFAWIHRLRVSWGRRVKRRMPV